LSTLAYNTRNKFDLKTPTGFDDNKLGAVGVWDAAATWTFNNGTTDPAELTVWRLDAKHDILTSLLEDDGTWWFPLQTAGKAYENGLFHYKAQSTGGGEKALATVPCFDQQVEGKVPTEVTYLLPVCMDRSFGDATFATADSKLTQTFDKNYYYNSPQDYKALTQNFDITPVYHRWFKPGDTSILHATTPWSFQVGRDMDTINQDSVPEADPIMDENRFAWRPKYGPCYLFRIRGSPVYDNAETVATTQTPKQAINFGAALLNVISHYEAHVNLIPYSQDPYIYRTAASSTLQLQDNMTFANERHISLYDPTIENHFP